MNNFSLLKELIDEVELFEKSNSKGNLEMFSKWLHRKHSGSYAQKNEGKPVNFKIKENQSKNRFPEVELSTLLTGVFRFAKHYVKKALANTEIRTLEEFGFLAMLLERGKMSKSDLIQQHLIELSSGTEISKRLIRQGFIEEFPDPKDRRAKLMQLTDNGKREIIRAFATMHQASLIVKGNLDNNELEELIRMLEKLNQHHWNIHNSDKDSSLPVLMGKYVQ